MKAEIDAKGCLSVIAETPLEQYALEHWYNGWQPKNPEGCPSVLRITNAAMQEISDNATPEGGK